MHRFSILFHTNPEQHLRLPSRLEYDSVEYTVSLYQFISVIFIKCNKLKQIPQWILRFLLLHLSVFRRQNATKSLPFTKIANWNSNIYWKETNNVLHHVFISEIYLLCIVWTHEATSSSWFSFVSILSTFIGNKYIFSIKYQFAFVYGLLWCIVVIRMLYTQQQSLTSKVIMLHAIQNALYNYI